MNGVDEVMSPLTYRRHRSPLLRFVALALVLLMGAASCTSSSTVEPSSDAIATPAPATVEATAAPTEAPAPEPTASEPTEPESSTTEPSTPESSPEPEPSPTPHPIAVAETELPRAPIGIDQLDQLLPTQGPQPVSIGIENIDVDGATVIPVGVNDEDLSFEVPPADQVGWYEFGPAPGQLGSSVLAAHIAYNGVDGVFRYLEDVEIGSIVVIGFDDGSTSRYRIEEVIEYVKEELPDSLFARDGREQLALITCGGAFNYQLDSYESNTVAIAVPI